MFCEGSASEEPGSPAGEAGLSIRLFGGFELRAGGRLLRSLRSRSEQWLLALLALRADRDTDREWLAETLWPDSKPERALFYLRRGLSDLRRALEGQAARLQSPTLRTLRLDLSGADCDVLRFDAALARGDRASLEEAVSLYRGPLLPECPQEWVSVERGRRELAFFAALDRLTDAAVAAGDLDAALGTLRQALLVDPLRESLHCRLMEVLALHGDYAAVTQLYRDLRLLLHRELNTAPAAETTALYERIRARGRQLGSGGSMGSVGSVGSVGTSSSSHTSHTPHTPPQGHIPQPLSSLIGRDQELREIRTRLASARLVTLTGTGGVGKTRLAIQVLEELAPDYPDGAWFVDLSALSAPEQVLPKVAATLGIQEQPGRPLLETLQEALRPRRLLLAPDNCEHVLEAAARLVEELLLECRDLRVLATSREALRLPGEVAWRVPSLAVPDPGILDTPGKEAAEALLEYEAVRLFAERAGQAQEEFRLTLETARVAAEVCRRLDGIPLAIELAAARLRTLSVQKVAARLDDRFRLLTGGSRTALPRQQTLRAALDWSYHLLSEPERTLLRRLSVFAGGWTLEAAEAVCGEEGSGFRVQGLGSLSPLNAEPRTLNPHDVLDLLTSLVTRSLVLFEHPAPPRSVGRDSQRPPEPRISRYRLLETVRQYARERLAEAGETALLRERHRTYYTDLAETAGAHLQGPEQGSWLERLDQEQDNLWAALDGCLSEVETAEAGLRLAGALSEFWSVRSDLARTRELVEALIARSAASERTPARARALRGAGRLAYDQGDFGAARVHCEQGLAIWRALGDPPGTAESLLTLALIARSQSEYETAAAYYTESLAIYRQIGDRPGMAWALDGLARVRYYRGEFPAARELAEAGLAIRRELGDRRGISMSLTPLAAIAMHCGDYAAARRLQEEGLGLSRELGDRHQIANLLSSLGDLAYGHGELDRAGDLLEASLAIRQELGDECGIAQSRHMLGFVARARGECDRAAVLLQASLATYERLEDRRGIAWALCDLGRVAYCRGDWSAARRQQEQSLAIRRELEDRLGVAECLEQLGALACVQGEGAEGALQAARIWGAAEAMRTAIGGSEPPACRAEQERRVVAARARLSDAAFHAAWEQGRTMSPEQAIAEALATSAAAPEPPGGSA